MLVMDYDISVSDSKTYIHVRVNEPVTLQVLKGFMHETAEKANEYGIGNFLFDLHSYQKPATLVCRGFHENC